MGRRANYGFEKRQREIKKQKKNEEKAERKRQEAMGRTEQQGADAPGEDASDPDGPGPRRQPPGTTPTTARTARSGT